MPRLFVTQREVDYFNDITKEIVKDIVGQQIIYWPVSILKTKVHSVYDEAVKKIFENPLRIDCLVGELHWETKMTSFGAEQTNTIDVFVQDRDLVQKGIQLFEGDYFTYGEEAYEIVSLTKMNNYYGQVEHNMGFKMIGKLARPGEFDPKKLFGPNNQVNPTTNFVQQRGLPETVEGVTGDIRDIRERLGDDLAPIALGEGPRMVGVDSSLKANKLYDE